MARIRITRGVASFLALLLVSGAPPAPAAASPAQPAGPAIRIFVDGRSVPTDVEPLLREGRVLIPMRAVFEALGAAVQWDPATRTATAVRGATTLRLTVDSRKARVNGATQALDVAPLIAGGRTLVPLRFAAEALGATVQWAPLTRSVWVWSQPLRQEPDDATFRRLLADLHWIVYSPSTSAPSASDLLADLAALRSGGFDGLIVYDTNALAAGVPRLARELGFQGVIAGLTLETDAPDTLSAEDWSALERVLSARESLTGIIAGRLGVGERYDRTFLREIITALQASGRRVTTAEDPPKYHDSDLGQLGDWLAPVLRPWDVHFRNPRDAAWVISEAKSVQDGYPDRPLLVAEAGFPTSGTPYLGEAAQAAFFRELQGSGVPAAWFEAFDREADAEIRWGLYNERRTPKLAALPRPQVSYELPGLAFSPYTGAQDPNKGAAVGEEQLAARLRKIAPYTERVRTYGATNGLERAAALAHSLGMGVAVGAWLGRDRAANEREIAGLLAAADADGFPVLVVGSEVLLRGDLTEDELLAYIARVRAKAPGLTVTTAETYGVLLAHPRVLEAVDVVYAHIYPFWEGVAIDDAIGALNIAYLRLKDAAKGKEVIVAETGWPSGGESNGAAVPSPENAAAYFRAFTSWARASQVTSFYFEALDEPWKAAYEGERGAHWGLFTEGGALKPGMEQVFAGTVTPDTWTGTILIDGEGKPTIAFTSVPEYGTMDLLVGKVAHVRPRDFRVAVYIRVNGGWWIKPYFDMPKTTVRSDGTWSADIVTGGDDREATRLAAFLLPAGVDPPLARGESSLPAGLAGLAVASVEVSRTP